MKKHCFVIVALIAVLSGPARAQEIGLELYSLRNQFKTDVAGTLDMVQKWGFRELEGTGSYGLPVAEFVKMLGERNLQMISTSAEYQQLRDNPQAVAANAKALGARYVVCFWIPHQGTEFTFENIRDATEVFSRAGKVLHENGLSLCYHPHGYEFRPYGDGTLFDYLVANTDPKYFNLEMDVFWIKHPGQDPVALLNRYPDRFPLMHLKDRKPGTPGNQNGQADVESNVVLGAGDVGIAAIMKAAQKAGVKHFFIEDESSRSVEQIPLSLAFLKSLEEVKQRKTR